jgi:aconitate hydratase 2/2-methylisocitrate dehydratase
MDFRDVVHATQSQMLKQFGGENVFQGRIIEVALEFYRRSNFTFTDWTAEMKAKASICISERYFNQIIRNCAGKNQIMIDKGMDNAKF